MVNLVIIGFKKIDSSININSVASQENAIEKWESVRDDHIEKLRGESLGKTTKLESKEFHEELYKMLRNNESSKVEIDKVDVQDLLEIVSSFKDSRKKAKDTFDGSEKSINNFLKDINDAEKTILKSLGDEGDAQIKRARSTAIKYISTMTTANKSRLGILQQVQGGLMSAMKQENRQAKAVCVRLLRYTPKNEGYSYDGGSLISSVVLK